MLSPKQQEEIIWFCSTIFLDCSQSRIGQYSRNLVKRLQPRKGVTSPKESSLSQGDGWASLTSRAHCTSDRVGVMPPPPLRNAPRLWWRGTAPLQLLICFTSWTTATSPDGQQSYPIEVPACITQKLHFWQSDPEALYSTIFPMVRWQSSVITSSVLCWNLIWHRGPNLAKHKRHLQGYPLCLTQRWHIYATTGQSKLVSQP